jgi:hypothetical protein
MVQDTLKKRLAEFLMILTDITNMGIQRGDINDKRAQDRLNYFAKYFIHGCTDLL